MKTGIWKVPLLDLVVSYQYAKDITIFLTGTAIFVNYPKTSLLTVHVRFKNYPRMERQIDNRAFFADSERAIVSFSRKNVHNTGQLPSIRVIR